MGEVGEEKFRAIVIDPEAETMDLDEFFSILEEKPSLPATSQHLKASPIESDHEEQSNVVMPPLGSDSLNFELGNEADSQELHGFQGTGHPIFSETLDASLSDCLEPDACNTLQEDELCETISSPSDLFQDFEYARAFEQLGPIHLVDSGRPQQRDGSVLASDWKPSAISENDTFPHLPVVNPVDDARDAEIYGGFNANTCLQNSKLNPNILNGSISGNICQNSTTRELVDLTQTDSSEDEMEYRQFGQLSRKEYVNLNARRKLPSWVAPSKENTIKKGSREISQRNLTLSEASDWNSRKLPINAQERRIVGLQFQGDLAPATIEKPAEKKVVIPGNSFQHGEISFEHEPVIKEEWRGESIFDSKFNQKPVFPGSSYQHGEFGSEYKPHIKDEWSGGSFSSHWKLGSANFDSEVNQKPVVSGNSYQHGEFSSEDKPYIKEWESGSFSSHRKLGSANFDSEVNQKPTLKDISYCNDDSDTEDVSTYSTERRHLPPTLGCGNPLITIPGQHIPPRSDAGFWAKSDDERQTYRAVLQDLAQPELEASPDDGLLAVPLLRHQRIALAWMVQKETGNVQCAGGILADDQGLGKTISTISLILKERAPLRKSALEDSKENKTQTSAVNLDEDDVEAVDNERKTSDHAVHDFIMKENDLMKESLLSVRRGRPSAGTLVVCPTSVIRQWAQELRDKVTAKANLSVLVYHGGNRTKDPDELAKYDVVLTTYSIVSMEVPKQEPADEQEEDERNPDDYGVSESLTSKKKKKPSGSLKKGAKVRKGSNGSSSESTPRPLARVGWFRVVLDEAQSIKNHRTQVARACWGLRAKRRWCLSGTPIQNTIDDLYSYFRFLKYEPYAVYKSFCSHIKVPITRNPDSGYKKLQVVLKTVMLRRTKGSVIDGQPIVKLPPKTITLKKVDFSGEERAFYCRLEADSRAQFKVYAAAGTVKQNYVNILLMLLRLRQACDHPRLVKGCSSDSTWRSSAEAARKLPREKQIDLMNCLEGSLAICGMCNDAPEEAVVTVCGHVFCNQCISDHLTQGDDHLCPSPHCKGLLKAGSVFSLTTLKNCTSNDYGNDENSANSAEIKEPESCLEDVAADSSKIKAALETLQTLPKLRTSISKSSSTSPMNKDSSSPGSTIDDSVGDKTSDIFDEMNQDLQPTSKKQILETTEKAIVFSQWTSMLDLLEVPLKKSCIQYRRLDGTMSVVARDKAVNDFNTLPEVTVMIMSLKAASLGLNMVAACHVLLLDLWWNPTTEDQAIDRAHRIGQTRPVVVSRFTVRDTVEDRILALQERKREMVASAFGEDEAGGRQTRLTEEDLRYLFMV
eukprot:Gb_33076 [translate_table: standard]